MAHETVLITGASSGIGRELAQCFAADGGCLVLVARRGGALESLAAELRQTHKVDARVVVADLAETEAPARIIGQLQHHGLKVDVLVNNAGFGAQGRFAELPLERQLEMIQVNVTALTHLSRLLLPDMIKRGRGGILNVASTAALDGAQDRSGAEQGEVDAADIQRVRHPMSLCGHPFRDQVSEQRLGLTEAHRSGRRTKTSARVSCRVAHGIAALRGLGETFEFIPGHPILRCLSSCG